MTGPEHYEAAETLLAKADEGGPISREHRVELAVRAQAHATLALVAATARVSGGGMFGGPAQWSAVLRDKSTP